MIVKCLHDIDTKSVVYGSLEGQAKERGRKEKRQEKEKDTGNQVERIPVQYLDGMYIRIFNPRSPTEYITSK